jgi:hypothetical protein
MKRRSFNEEGGGWERRRIAPSTEKEVVGNGEGSVLQGRRRRLGTEKGRSFNGDRGGWERRRIGPSREIEEIGIDGGSVLQRRRRRLGTKKE